jgi:hypothetical protein
MSADPSTLETVGPSPEVAACWDHTFGDLWDTSLSRALQAAGKLYRRDGEDVALNAEVAEALPLAFWRILTGQQAHKPETVETRYGAVLRAVWIVLRAVRKAPANPTMVPNFVVALRPVRWLHAGALTPEICAALYDYNRGIWWPYLSRPQMWEIRTALARTIAALPPNEMDAFWENLHSPDAARRHAMQEGLKFLRSAHAVPHLLRGLERSGDHATRAAIVDCLEEIADPRAIAMLTRLRQETAHGDWTLSRHIARVIRVIEQQNRGQSHRTLLRPAQSPPQEADSLLRPAADSPNTSDSLSRQLLRPKGPN